MIQRIDHVNLVVDDLEAVIAFYDPEGNLLELCEYR